LNVYNNYRLAKIAHKNKIPVVLTCHDTIIANSLPILVRWLKNLYDATILKRLNSYVDYFILNTKDQIIDLTKANIDPKKLAVIPVGIDSKRKKINQRSERILLKKYELLGKKYLFNIGRIEEYKGIQDIMYAAHKMPEQLFVIAGKDQGYLNQLKKIENRLKIKNVRFIGEINDTEKEVLLKNSNIFLFTSKREGWGIVMVEAMSYGIPCIAYNIKNIRTVFTNKKSGILINNRKELETAIKYLSDDKRWKEYSKNCIPDTQKYDYRILFPEVLEIFKKLHKKKH